MPMIAIEILPGIRDHYVKKEQGFNNFYDIEGINL